jgi:natural product precursor
MRKRTSHKLKLSKETLWKLKSDELKRVKGGATDTCNATDTCFGETCVGYTCYDGCTGQSLCYDCFSVGYGC